MNNSSLLLSVCTLCAFYYLLGIAVYLFVPVSRINDWLADIGLELSIDKDPLLQMSVVLESLSIRLEESLTFLLLGIVWGLALLCLLLLVNILMRQSLKGKASWKTLSSTISVFPGPLVYQSGSAHIVSLPGNIGPRHKTLLSELLSFACDNKNHAVKPGHDDTGLYRHTLSDIEQAFDRDDRHELLPLAAAAHNLGTTRTLAFNDTTRQWHSLKPGHNLHSVQLLKAMPGWEKLPEPDRHRLYLAVKYENSPDSMPLSIPGISQQDIDSARQLLSQLRELSSHNHPQAGTTDDAGNRDSDNRDSSNTDSSNTDSSTGTAAPVTQTLANTLSAFFREAPCYHPNHSGEYACFIRKGLVYILESSLRAYITGALPGHQAHPAETGKRMAAIFHLLDDMGLLQTRLITRDNDCYQTGADCPLWNVSLGTVDYNAVLVITAPDEIIARQLPDTEEDCLILSPYRASRSVKIRNPADIPDGSNVTILHAGKTGADKKNGRPGYPKPPEELF